MASEWVVAENKDRAELPEWIVKAVNRVRGQASPNQTPIVTLTSPNSLQILVVMDMRDFKGWHGSYRAQPAKDPEEATY